MEQYSYEDVTPVNINLEEPQLCQILYDDEYKSVMGILLALLKQNEYSERALYITELGLELLASHYTIWVYRYRILTHLKRDLVAELDWCEQIALENEKNYQIWNYRQLIINKILEDPSNTYDPHREGPLINAMLEEDTKNHHVWSYRKWLVEKFGLYQDPKELEFVEACLLLDLRNNSAWSHRFFLKFGANNITEAQLKAEIDYTKLLIEKAPQNPSAWNYLLGIFHKSSRSLAELQPFCEKLADYNNEDVKSSYALETLAKIYNEQQKREESGKIYDLLGDRYDPIRRNYWRYEKSRIQAN
ncbi:protein prenylyltransferase [Suhomyces tanzawaensis NRRL Y-17324]|uniref:Protein farnesyltransferase/geranylgeranyltransferase type-1 subunit alpha n=1 Tax=Suhomyces tanzawaensis NRRL Y-17324 TaxID=984487 RepID=A0A1E4SD48_9ASCO|nr:protein prenylyltransferase [Suhomyces tanzawaensis NRRL Y-17324]ODV77441.1 protein prenylyltransferase [Suhomyces tanzawaensis NRRL Y-17324]